MTAYERRYPGAQTARAARPARRPPPKAAPTPGWAKRGKYASSRGARERQKNYRQMVAYFATCLIRCPECQAEPGQPCRGSDKAEDWYRVCRSRWMLARPQYGKRKIPKGMLAEWRRAHKRRMHSVRDVRCARCGDFNDFRKLNPDFPLCRVCLDKLYRPDQTEDWQLRVLRAELRPDWRISREADGYFLVQRCSEPSDRGWLDDWVLEGPSPLRTIRRSVLRWNWAVDDRRIGLSERALRLMESLPWRSKGEMERIAYKARVFGPSWRYPYINCMWSQKLRHRPPPGASWTGHAL